MGKMAIDRSQSTLVDAFLRDEMARGNRALRSVAPVIGHMLDSEGPSLFGDAIVARLRGMINDIAAQFVGELPLNPENSEMLKALVDVVAQQLASDETVVDHLYSVALEGHLTAKLKQTASIDPVLSPLMQELIASDKPEIAEIAMSTMAAQSRFAQSQNRMEMPVGELPFEVFSRVLDLFEAAPLGAGKHHIDAAIAKLKRAYDEGAGRIGLLARLSSSMHGGAIAALDLSHAGLALFASAMASLTGQPREHAVFACHEAQIVRLALMLKAAGLSAHAIEGQLAVLGGTKPLPDGFAALSQSVAQDTLREMSEV
ncbi:hypothetical protein EH31_02250 [Erythrobacter longus]|uniref:Uncharacterized protein n=1 Tax=Erythrobacter longus TaxID=1044 RepID=A0A074M9L5_ERYLO|nr:hypothetical protein [Erythrobacter longus]KEO91511.1 hypothetical protein EH31_02250 [Erythrobacter longus]